ncbi:ptges2, partial [Symbiodinium sp. CCMP2456]
RPCRVALNPQHLWTVNKKRRANMGCCNNKELYIVCSWDWDEGELLASELRNRSSQPEEKPGYQSAA